MLNVKQNPTFWIHTYFKKRSGLIRTELNDKHTRFFFSKHSSLKQSSLKFFNFIEVFQLNPYIFKNTIY